MKYILALDQGTTSSRAIVFDHDANMIASEQFEFEQIFPQPGWVEHDPKVILDTQFRAAKGAIAKAGIAAGDISAIGITNQRETAVVWDKNTGEPVYNAIVWQCRRTAEICESLKEEGWGEYITEHTGLLIDAYFAGTKVKWILDNVPGAKEKAQAGDLIFGTIDTWLIWNLTGGAVHATDYTNACRTMIFDIDSLKWDEKLCDKLGIPMSMLPEARPSSGSFGTVANIEGLEELAGVPISGVAGDQQSALFGQACFEPGDAKNTYGTGCFVLLNTGEKRIKSHNQLLSTIAWGMDGKVTYALEGSIFNAGSVIKWLRDSLGLISTANEVNILAESVPDNGGVYFVPAFTGLGAPYWDMYARGTMVGLTRGSGKGHIARSVLESIAYQVRDFIEAMVDDSGLELSQLKVDGGASVSNVMMQFQADMLGRSVNRPRNVETTALGAAYLAGLAVGYWHDKSEVARVWQSERVFEPQMSRQQADDLYAGWKRAVERSLDWEQHN